jgi:hypothetical protein
VYEDADGAVTQRVRALGYHSEPIDDVNHVACRVRRRVSPPP